MGPVFDVACDCEDGAPVGRERAHAKAMAALIAGTDNAFGRVGARIHDLTHPAWRSELDILLGEAGARIAFLTLPKANGLGDVQRFLHALREEGCARRRAAHDTGERHGRDPGAVHDAWAIAALPGMVSLDFGTLDFVSAHHGAIPAAAMHSPGQFDHPLLRRAKCEVAAAALAHGVVPAHGVTLALDDPEAVYADADAGEERVRLPAHVEHPPQPDRADRARLPPRRRRGGDRRGSARRGAGGRLGSRSGTTGKLYDRASYRYCWDLLQQAHATGAAMPAAARAFFTPRSARRIEPR